MDELKNNPTVSPAKPTPPLPKPRKHWGSVLKFSAFAIAAWAIEFMLQYHWLSLGELGPSLTRSFALTGTSLTGLALFSSAIFKWFPKTAIHWRLRRYLGVSGFVFIFFHILTAFHFYFNYDLSVIYSPWNPIQNPLMFGAIAFPILLIMTITSTDWMVKKLTPKVWKCIHRFVYIAYPSLIFHFVLTHPALLNNPPGYVLILITVAAIFGQLYWFFKTVAKRKAKE